MSLPRARDAALALAACLAALPVLAACGEDGGAGAGETTTVTSSASSADPTQEPTTPSTAGASAPAGPTTLTITVTQYEGDPGTTSTLTCDPVGGDHPAAAAACEWLAAAAAAGTDPFAPKRADEQCAQQYYGPETATVKGTWQGQKVAATFSRRDACEERRWIGVQAIVPVPPSVGSTPG